MEATEMMIGLETDDTRGMMTTRLDSTRWEGAREESRVDERWMMGRAWVERRDLCGGFFFFIFF